MSSPRRQRADSLSSNFSFSMSGSSSFGNASMASDGLDTMLQDNDPLTQGTASLNTLGGQLFRRRFSIPVSMVLQALFVASVVVVLITACALFSSFVSGVRDNVALKLMDQLASCSAQRLEGHVSDVGVQLLFWQQDMALRLRSHASDHAAILDVESVVFSMARLATIEGSKPQHAAGHWTTLVTAQIQHSNTEGVEEPTMRRWPHASVCNGSVAVSLYWTCDVANVTSRGVAPASTTAGGNIASSNNCISPGWTLALFAVRGSAVVVASMPVDEVDVASIETLLWRSDAAGRWSDVALDAAGFTTEAACLAMARQPIPASSNAALFALEGTSILPPLTDINTIADAAGIDLAATRWSRTVADVWNRTAARTTAWAAWPSTLTHLYNDGHRDTANRSDASSSELLIGTTQSMLLWNHRENVSDGAAAPPVALAMLMQPIAAFPLLSAAAVSAAAEQRAMGLLDDTEGIFCFPAPANGGLEGTTVVVWHNAVQSSSAETSQVVVEAVSGVEIVAPRAVNASGGDGDSDSRTVTYVPMGEAALHALTFAASRDGVFQAVEYVVPHGSASNDDGIVIVAAITDYGFDHGEVQEGIVLMILISVAIGVALVTLASFLIQALTRGVVKLAEDFARVERFDVAEEALASLTGEATCSGQPTMTAAARMKSSLHALKRNVASAFGARSSLGDGPVTIRSISGSVFRELDGVSKGLRMLVRHVLTLRRFAPSFSSPRDPTLTVASAAADLRGPSQGGGGSPEDDQEKAVAATAYIFVKYESRSTSKEFGRAEFPFQFDPDEASTANEASARLPGGKKPLFARLVAECVEHCGEDPFQQVTLTYVSPNNEHIVLRTSLQVVEILSVAAAAAGASGDGTLGASQNTNRAQSSEVLPLAFSASSYTQLHPGTVRILMHKSTKPKLAVQLTSFADVFNMLSTLVFVARLGAKDGVDAGLIAFCCLYVFALSTNVVLCLVLVRQMISKDAAFEAWVEKRGVELCACVFFSTLNLQNFELMWTGIRLEWNRRTVLFFNAPPNDDAIFKSIQWSVVGFLFSDVTQLIFKAWVVVSGGSDVQVESLFTLATSSVSVVFNVAVKLHATFLWTRSVETSVLRTHEDDGNDGTTHGGGGANTSATLVQKDCSLLLVRCQRPADVHQLSLLAVEWGQCYEVVLSCARKAKATVLVVNSGTVLLALNVARSVSQGEHETEAVHLALQINALFAQAVPNWTIAITVTSGVFLTGVLGSFHKKTSHVLVPLRGLSLLGATGLLLARHMTRGVILVSSGVCRNALGVDIAAAPPGEVCETQEYVEGAPLLLMRPAQMFASLRRKRTGLSSFPMEPCVEGNGSLVRTGPASAAASPVLSTDGRAPHVVVQWQEFAFLYRADDVPPSVVDTRTRFLTAALGWSELNMEKLRVGLGKLFERGWHSGIHETSHRSSLHGRSLHGRRPSGENEEGSSDSDDEDVKALNRSTSSSGRRSSGAATGAAVVVSPRKLFALL